MALIPFALTSYKSRSLPLSSQRCINLLAEKQPESTKVPAALFGAPGIRTTPFSVAGTGPIRAMRVMSNILYVVSGTELYEVSPTGQAILRYSGLPANGNVAMMSDNGAQLAILVDKKLFVYLTSTTAPVVTPPGSEQVLTGSTTSLRDKANTGATKLQILFINSLIQWQPGDPITVLLDNGTQFHTTLVASQPYAAVGIAAGLPSAARRYNQVIDETRGEYTFLMTDHGAGTTGLAVAAAETMAVGDQISIALDNGGQHITTITYVVAGPAIDIANALPSQASAGMGVANTQNRLYPVVDPNFFPSDSVTYFDNYFVFNRSGTNQFFLSEIGDGTTYPPLSFASAQVAPDDVVAVFASHEVLLVFGQRTIETWYDAGTPNFPFQRYDGATIQRGTAAPLSIVEEANAVHFMGDDLVYYRLQGVQPVRISTHAIETAWRNYTTCADCFGFSYSLEGHKFIVLMFPTANMTWVYDISTEMWHERMSFLPDSDVMNTRWRCNMVVDAYQRIMAGDLYSGTIAQMDWTTYTEFGSLIQGQVISPPYREDRKRLFVSRFELEIEAGVGRTDTPDYPTPMIRVNDPFPFAASPGNEVKDTTADPQVADFFTMLSDHVAAGGRDIRVENAESIGWGDTLEIYLDDRTVFKTTVKFIYSPMDPKIYLDYSKDGGFTYSTPQLPRTMGRNGEVLTRCRWLRLGQAREWYFRLTILDPVKRVIIGAYADMYPGA